ncbi:MAG: tRNA (cytidine/uridine-2'-O-)-methyltransferase [Planctomycetota bacterium]|jgi:tRNA (cytidine/uridine-2'-O-)-methyltransferase
MDVVLVHPEIPHNSGCAGRLTAAVGACLHLVEPLGFSLEDRYLKRAGLDYWPQVDLCIHKDWAALEKALSEGSERPLAERLKLFSARGGKSLFESEFAADDVLVFGSESGGIPKEILEMPGAQRVYLPIQSGIRSLNLANVVAVGLYTAMDRAGVALPENDGSYEAHAQTADDIWPHHVAKTREE